MDPDKALATYRRLVMAGGELVTIKRKQPAAPPPGDDEEPEPDPEEPVIPTEVTVRARVIDASSDEMDDGSQQGRRKVIVLAEDIPSNFLPLREKGADKVVLRGALCTIEFVDDSTRRIGGVLIAYELHVSGGR